LSSDKHIYKKSVNGDSVEISIKFSYNISSDIEENKPYVRTADWIITLSKSGWNKYLIKYIKPVNVETRLLITDEHNHDNEYEHDHEH